MNDDELKQLLAKMLPEKVRWTGSLLTYIVTYGVTAMYTDPVKETELLQLCWEIEEQDRPANLRRYLDGKLDFVKSLQQVTGGEFMLCYHATWQQRVVALAKVKGIEL